MYVCVYILVCPHAYAIVATKVNFDWESLSSVMHPVIQST